MLIYGILKLWDEDKLFVSSGYALAANYYLVYINLCLLDIFVFWFDDVIEIGEGWFGKVIVGLLCSWRWANGVSRGAAWIDIV